MDYTQDILNKLLDQLERRKKSDKPVTFFLAKKYPDYREPFSDCHEPIHAAVNRLIGWGILTGEKDVQGYYTKLTMELENCPEAYRIAKRQSKEALLEQQKAILQKTQGGELVTRVCRDFAQCLEVGRFPAYGIGQDSEKLQDILTVLQKITELKTETYVRNFSEAVFHNSKRFQAIQASVVHILMDYTQDAVDEDTILEQYELYQNPSYVYFKGGWKLYVGEQSFDVSALPGGMGLPAAALEKITQIELTADRVISVENLTTYHDTPENGAAVLYLGGFPNHLRIQFLKLLYKNEPNAQYFHRGDLDPYGFLILQNLRSRTQIPFVPLEMDLQTLEQCFKMGHYRPLDKQDLKIMEHPLLKEYQEIFEYMRLHNCKIEQECFEAMKLNL